MSGLRLDYSPLTIFLIDNYELTKLKEDCKWITPNYLDSKWIALDYKWIPRN